MFPEAKPRETLRSRGNKTHCFPRGQSLSVLLYLPTQNIFHHGSVRKSLYLCNIKQYSDTCGRRRNLNMLIHSLAFSCCSYAVLFIALHSPQPGQSLLGVRRRQGNNHGNKSP